MADLSINAAAVSPGSGYTPERGYPAGATITAGQLVYKDANNRWSLVDTDAGSGVGCNAADVRGIALHNSANTQPLVVATADANFGIGATVANGVGYWASNVAGGITATAPAAGNYSVFVGIGISTSRITLRPLAAGVAV
jgi:hypothetical protein